MSMKPVSDLASARWLSTAILRSTWIGTIMCFLGLFGMALADVGLASPPQEKDPKKAKDEPAIGPLELRLVANKDAYPLDLGGQTAEEFRKQIDAADKTKNYPAPPSVDLVLILKNTGDKELQVLAFGSDGTAVQIKLDGPGAVRKKTRDLFYRRLAVPKWIELAPGKEVAYPMAKLADYAETFGSLTVHQSYWTAPGEYSLSATFKTAAKPPPAGADVSQPAFPYVTLNSNPIKLKISDASDKKGFSGQATKEPVTPALIRFAAVIIDTAGGAVYLRHKADAMQAIDLRTGEVRWDSKTAFLPISADSKRVAAVGLGKGGPIVVVFDPKGKVLKESDALPGNAWFGEGPTTHSSVNADIEGGNLIVRWSSRKSPFSGVAHIAMQVTSAIGEAKVDMATGKVTVVLDKVTLPDAKKPGPPAPTDPKGPGEVLPLAPDPKGQKPGPATPPTEPDLKLPAAVVEELEALHQKGCWPRSMQTGKPRPLVVGDQLVLVLYETVPAGRKFVLKSWDRATGKPREPATLAEGKELHVISAHGEFLFVQDIAGSATIEQRPVWVLSLDSGKQIAKLTYAQAMSPLCVLGDRLLRVAGSASEGVLESVDLATGKAVWSRKFYRYHHTGPSPP
jgi:hypothetical protein